MSSHIEYVEYSKQCSRYARCSTATLLLDSSAVNHLCIVLHSKHASWKSSK